MDPSEIRLIRYVHFTTLMTRRAYPASGLDSETGSEKIIPYSTFQSTGSWSHKTHTLLQGGEQAEGAGASGAEAGGGGGQASQAHRHALGHVASHVTPRHVLSRRWTRGRSGNARSWGRRAKRPREPSSQTRSRPRGQSRDSPSCTFKEVNKRKERERQELRQEGEEAEEAKREKLTDTL